jgi:hypothetical protein
MDQPEHTMRKQLLDAAGNGSSRHAQYQREVDAMLSAFESRVRMERRMVTALWIFLVLLCTSFMLIAGFHIDKSTAALWFGIQAVFWLLFGMVFLLMARFNQINLDLLKEIKRVELAVQELKDSLAGPPKA